jgi:2-oxo-4-hydroxy-4-carboxy-5-ureidoimidazoline decarboxylase
VSLSVEELNALASDRASELLRACCGASRWVAAMVRRRPFFSRDAVLQAADDEWSAMRESDWLEAFSHHPRIGETTAAAGGSATARGWSASEQSAAATSGDDARIGLARLNRDYERRFGFIYIVSATGKSAGELLELARRRMDNDRDTELRTAAEEQRKITRLRLEKLLDPVAAA